MEKLYIISNESVFEENGNFFCDNIDTKTTPEGLDKYLEVNLIARYSKKKRAHKININKVKVFKSIFSFLLGIYKSSQIRETKYLIISITPFTFLAILFLMFLKRKPIVYLRSDGYEEYKAIFGFIGPFIYGAMFNLVSKISSFISCRNYILRNKKGDLVFPSQLDKTWFRNYKPIEIETFKLLYVGRLKVEKGIFSFLKMIKNEKDIFLTIVGSENNVLLNNKQNNILVRSIETSRENLIKLYDDHNIFILPSFTEGHPMALLEALARRRPVVIFEEIKHVAEKKRGVFISKRDIKNFRETINYIKNDYKNIQKEMEKNILPNYEKFINDIFDLIKKN